MELCTALYVEREGVCVCMGVCMGRHGCEKVITVEEVGDGEKGL